MMRQTTPKTVQVCGNTFHVFPFAAFTAANLSAEVIRLLAPVIGSLMPLVQSRQKETGQKDGMDIPGGADSTGSAEQKEASATGLLDADIDMDRAGEALATAFKNLSGPEVERILKNLLTENRNISCEDENGNKGWLTQDLADEIFCGQPHGLFILAFHVILRNYAGFFGSAAPLSGGLQSAAGAVMTKTMAMYQSMGNLM